MNSSRRAGIVNSEVSTKHFLTFRPICKKRIILPKGASDSVSPTLDSAMVATDGFVTRPIGGARSAFAEIGTSPSFNKAVEDVISARDVDRGVFVGRYDVVDRSDGIGGISGMPSLATPLCASLANWYAEKRREALRSSASPRCSAASGSLRGWVGAAVAVVDTVLSAIENVDWFLLWA